MNTYLSFSISTENFTVNISKVLEVILSYKTIKVPDAPPFIEGVINFRGSIIPVINFRKKFNFEDTGQDSMLVVLEISENQKRIVFAAVVDDVKNVFPCEPEDILPIPKFGSKYNADYIEGMIKKEDDFYMIMNIEKVFSDAEIKIINEAAESDNK